METPGTTKDTENPQDTQIFYNGKKKYEVKLTCTELQWRVEGHRSEWKSCETKFLVGCKLEEKKDNNTKHGTLLVYYISKNIKSEIWKCEQLQLQHEDEQLLLKWYTQIHQHIQQYAIRPRRLLVFVNPESGGKKGPSVYDKQVAPLLEKAGIKTQVIVTKGPSEIPETINGYDLATIDGMVAVGGDGTYHMVTNALLRRLATDNGINIDDPQQLVGQKSDIPVGIIPCGTGQGFAKIAYGNVDPVTAALHIITGGVMDMNTFSIHNADKFVVYATMFCGYGGMGDTIKISERNRQLGKMRYLYSIARVIKDNALKQIELSYLPTKQPSESENDKVNNTDAATHGNMQCFTAGVRNISVFLMDLENRKFTDDLFIETWNESAGRWKIMKHLGGLMTMNVSGYDTEYFSAYHCTEVRLTVKASDLSDEVLNVDGELIEIKDPVLNMRVHNKNIKLYGHGSNEFHKRFDLNQENRT